LALDASTHGCARKRCVTHGVSAIGLNSCANATVGASRPRLPQGLPCWKVSQGAWLEAAFEMKQVNSASGAIALDPWKPGVQELMLAPPVGLPCPDVKGWGEVVKGVTFADHG